MAAAGHAPAAIAKQIAVTRSSVARHLRAGCCRECGGQIVASATGCCAHCVFQATHVALYTAEEVLARLREWHADTATSPSPDD